MNILYIDRMRKTKGDNGELHPFIKDYDKEYILRKFGDKVFYPEIFWDRGDYLSGYLSHIVDNNNIQAVVGYSAGGYMAMNISNKYKIPSLMFNPAIAENCKAPELQPPDEKMKSSPRYKYQIIVLGEQDTKESGGVDYQLVVEYLNKIHFKETGGEIFVEPMGHAPSIEVFEKYFDYFHSHIVLNN